MNRWCRIVLAISCLGSSLRTSAEEFLVFTSFRGNGEDGLHLSLSTNGYYWKALKDDRSFLKPALGGYNLMRDPCLAQGPDGVFHLVWTTGWSTDKGKTIGYSSSKDLIKWSEPKAITLMQSQAGTRNIWAPEVFYDSEQSTWLVFWSSTVSNRFPETASSGDDGYNHRFYCSTTRDFQSFSDSKLLYDPDFNCIDATLFRAEKRFVLFFKDERKTPLKKNLRFAVAESPQGPFRNLSEPFTGNWVEGPSAIKIGDSYFVYFDHYADPHFYGAMRSKDLQNWEDCSKEMTFPVGHRHGTVLRVSPDVARQLLSLE
jgi:hypothetical protein